MLLCQPQKSEARARGFIIESVDSISRDGTDTPYI